MDIRNTAKNLMKSLLATLVVFFCALPMVQAANNALDLDGNGDYVSFSTPPNIDFDEMTISWWVKVPSNAAVWKDWWSIGIAGGEMVAELTSSGHAAVYKIGTIAGANYVGPDTSSSALKDNNWHHLAVVMSKSGNYLKLYVDGTETSNSSSWSADAQVTSFRIGARVNGSYAINSEIDELKIYDVAMTAAQITLEHNAPDGRYGALDEPSNDLSANLVAGWHFDEESPSTTVPNMVTGGVTGTLAGNPGWVTGHVQEPTGSPSTVATPTFNYATGTYPSTINVEIDTTTSGATIHYTLDGNDPTTSSAQYSGTAIPISTTTTVKAKAYLTGSTDSAVATAVYTIDAGSPTGVNNALDLDGNGDWVSFSTPPNINLDEVSVSWWVNVPGNAADWDDWWALGMGTGEYVSELASGGKAALYMISSVPGAKHVQPTGINLKGNTTNNGWHHMVAVMSKSGNSVKLYQNGSLVGTPDTWAADAQVTTFAIGKRLIETGGNVFNIKSKIDELKIYDVSLSVAQVNLEYANGDGHYGSLSGLENNLVGWWSFDEESGQTVPDESGNGIHGQLEGGAHFSGGHVEQTGSSPSTVATPTFNYPTNTYTSSINVTIDSATSGASIYYTLDGSTPTESSTEYLGTAISISSTTTLKAKAYLSGSTSSAVATATYTIDAGTPTGPNNALDLDGNGDWVSFAAPPNINMDEVTVSWWVNVPSNAAEWDDWWALGTSTGEYVAEITTGGKAALYMISSIPGAKHVQPAGINLKGSTVNNGWHHMAAVMSKSGNYVKLYQNGSLIGTPDTWSADAQLTSFAIGKRLIETGGNQFHIKSKIDELKIYDVALSAAQVGLEYANSDGYYGPLSGMESNLVGWWSFDEESGSSVPDESGNGVNGQLQGGAHFVTNGHVEQTGGSPSTVATPTFNYPTNTYTNPINVTIDSPTSGASIHYTLDGVSTPTESSPQFITGTPIPINVTTTLKARAFASGMTSSAVATAIYTIDAGSPTGVNNALDLDGNGDWVSFSTPPNMNLDEVSVSWWVNVPGNAADWDDWWALGMGTGEYVSELASGGKAALYFISSIPGAKHVQPTGINLKGNTTNNGWHHMVAVMSKSGNSVKLYQNGSLVGTPDTWSADAQLTTFAIGKRLIETGGNVFNIKSKIDELKIYDVALSVAQVNLEYANGDGHYGSLSGLESNLVGWWSFDEESGQTVPDESGNGIHGLLEGGAHFSGGHVEQTGGSGGGPSGISISSFSIAQHSYLQVGQTASLTIVADNTGTLPTEYQVQIDGSPECAWSQNATCNWTPNTTHEGRHTIRAEARSSDSPPNSATPQEVDIFVIQSPVAHN